mgnify:CR=1 FL=1
MRTVVETTREFDQAISDYQAIGWEVDQRGADRAILKRGFRGSWLWHLLFLFLVPIVGNLCYSAYRRYNRPAWRVVRLRDGAGDATDPVEGEDA